MPYLNINGCKIYYEDTGEGEETLVLSHGLLWSGEMFEKQVEHFRSGYRVITFDHRGQGRSESTPSGYDMDQIYSDAVGLLEALILTNVHFGGLSMGGFVAMRLGARRPDLVKSLILMETSAQPEPNTLKYSLLNTIVRLFGVKSVTAPVMNIMFGEPFLNDPHRREEREKWKRKLQENKKTITRAVGGVIRRKSVVNELEQIKCPVLILAGEMDKATTVEKAQFIHSNIRHSELVVIPRAGHTACVEEPEAYNLAIENFLKNLVQQ
ncbi:MAG TPA: alpha/beta hydrolase [Saprospiraceae bacterium]|nr:alpha/beta hydrolase [Saprospiraceae bacterium]